MRAGAFGGNKSDKGNTTDKKKGLALRGEPLFSCNESYLMSC